MAYTTTSEWPDQTKRGSVIQTTRLAWASQLLSPARVNRCREEWGSFPSLESNCPLKAGKRRTVGRVCRSKLYAQVAVAHVVSDQCRGETKGESNRAHLGC